MKLDLQNAILLILCLVLLLGVFTLSANAADTVTELVPIYSNQVITSGFVFGRNAGGNDLYAFRSSDVPVYMFAVGTSVYFVSESTTTVRWGSRNNNVPNTMNLSLLYDNTYHYNATGVASTTLPSYASIDSGMSAVSDYIESVNNPPSPLEYSLPPGNIIYIPIPSVQNSISYTLTTTYYMAFGNNDTSRINQVVTVRSALPSSTNNVAPSSPLIPWTNNGNVNLLGTSAHKIYQSTIPTNLAGQFLVIVNPLTMPSQAGLIGGDIYTNGNINISVSAVGGTPYVYPMSERLILNYGDDIGSESTFGDDPYTYTVDPDTGEIIWSDPDGGNTAPVSGGQNPMPTPNTIFDWLRNISQQLSDFLKGPVQAVQVVVSAIRDFMSSFTQLYSWLPSPVYSLITSALMIALTIGVIKIFV